MKRCWIQYLKWVEFHFGNDVYTPRVNLVLQSNALLRGGLPKSRGLNSFRWLYLIAIWSNGAHPWGWIPPLPSLDMIFCYSYYSIWVSWVWLSERISVKRWFHPNSHDVGSRWQSILVRSDIVTSDVLQYPYKESWRIRVNFESRYGMCSRPWERDCTTWPRHESEELIFLASSRVSPLAPVLATFSDPARSTRLSLPPWFT